GIGELVLLLAPAHDAELDEEARERVAALLRERLSPRHVPDYVIELPNLPRTLTGKKLEVPVKRILAGAPIEAAVSADAITHAEVLPLLAPALEAERRRRAARRTPGSTFQSPTSVSR
ncbi:MAG TPA: hypothetical protein VNY33_05590, partial [Gaiellaceae bacterium]|nr:hypothetical protein [Gaiellaceae bacterium]